MNRRLFVFGIVLGLMYDLVTFWIGWKATGIRDILSIVLVIAGLMVVMMALVPSVEAGAWRNTRPGGAGTPYREYVKHVIPDWVRGAGLGIFIGAAVLTLMTVLNR